jgi:FKBP-type peptidyl-prolyl cis-trans isomerase FklB
MKCVKTLEIKHKKPINNMKKIILLTVVMIGFTAVDSSAQVNKKNEKKETASPAPKLNAQELKNSIDSFSYAVGLNIGESLKNQGVPEMNLKIMNKAIEDIMKDRPKLISPEKANMTLQQKIQEFTKKKGEQAKAKEQQFLETCKKKNDVIALPNGLLYEIIKAGDPSGIKPRAIDTVVVDYVGRLADGTEFDNSFKRGQPATFPLGGVIRGWTEILQLMTVGAHWKVYIPSELGYGERGAGGSIPPNATLIFEITLKEIKVAASK